ncbi:MAG: DUF2330 domain-containing protein [Candidatus Sericytochromatia bacterium]
MRLSLLIAILLLWPVPALATALAWRAPGYAVPLAEEALIIWQPETHVEHLILRADFETDKPDLGLLIPTPTVPTINAIDQAIFARLGQQIQPREQSHTSLNPSLLLWLLQVAGGSPTPDNSAGSDAAVEVLTQRQVAGYEVSVLRSASPAALRDWLRKRRYAVRPGLEAWLQPYLRKHWAIMACKLSQVGPVRGLRLQALDLRFITATPFYPYREPGDGANSGEIAAPARQLRLFLLGPEPLTGAYGSDSHLGLREGQPLTLAGVSGPSRLLYSARPGQSDLFAGLPATDLPQSPWLSAYLDESPRRGDPLAGQPGALAELFFYPIRAQAYLPLVSRQQDLVLPLDVVAAGLLLLWVLRRRRRPSAGLTAGPIP